MTEIKRRVGRPAGTLDTLGEYEAIEVGEAMVDAVIDERSRKLAQSTTDNGFETDHEAATRRFKEQSRQERLMQWQAYPRRMSALFRSLADKHARALEKLTLGEEALGEVGK